MYGGQENGGKAADGNDNVLVRDIPVNDFTLKEKELFTRDGYEFKGWKVTIGGVEFDKLFAENEKLTTALEAAGETVNYKELIMMDAAVVVKAQWAKESFNITFDLDGGTQTNDAALTQATIENPLTGNQMISNVPTAHKTGHEFVGWMDEANKFELMVDMHNIKRSATLKAIWAPKELNGLITYEGNGGIVVDENSAINGYDVIAKNVTTEYFDAIENPFVKEGYTFVGWRLFVDDIDMDRPFNENEQVDVIIYQSGITSVADLMSMGVSVKFVAQWEKEIPSADFIVNYFGNGGTTHEVGDGTTSTEEVTNYTIGVETTIFNTKANMFTRDGYTFTGWKLVVHGNEIGNYAENSKIDTTTIIADETYNTPLLNFLELGVSADFVAQWEKDIVPPVVPPVTPPVVTPPTDGGNTGIVNRPQTITRTVFTGVVTPEVTEEAVEEPEIMAETEPVVKAQRPDFGKEEGTWGLANIILAAIAVVLGLVMLFQRRDDEAVKFRGMASKLTAAGAAVIAALVAILTQNFTGIMVFADMWTIALAGILLLQLVNLFVGKSENEGEIYFED